MNLNFAFVVFSLAVVALVAITYGNHKLASKAIEAIAQMPRTLIHIFQMGKSDRNNLNKETK